MTEKIKEKRDFSIFILSLLFAFVVIVFCVWAFWPYPKVTSEGTAKVVNTPASGFFKTGDLITWSTPEVCQPGGASIAEVFAVTEFDTGKGVLTVRTKLVEREFQIPDSVDDCIKNNRTGAYVDGTLGSGTYKFEIFACVKNRGPQDKCAIYQGPSDVKIVRVVGNE